MPADVKLFQENDWDIDFQGGDIAKTYTFDTALYMSIFCEVRAKSWEIQNPLNRRGHFTNEFSEVEGYEVGSKLWLFTGRARNTAQNAEQIKTACQDGLAWLVQDRIIKNYTVEVIRNISQIQINIELQISETETLYKQAFINTFNAN